MIRPPLRAIPGGAGDGLPHAVRRIPGVAAAALSALFVLPHANPNAAGATSAMELRKTKMRRRWIRAASTRAIPAAVAVGLSVAVGACAQPTLAAGAGHTDRSWAAAEQIGHAGRWLTDASGRVVIIHGVNMPSKLLPAYPSARGFGPADAVLLARMGINAVRITVERYAVEPTPGTFDAAYVDHIAQTVQMLAEHHIFTLIDFHQDDFGPAFLDNGYPTWMTVTDGLTNNDHLPFPEQYVLNPALNRAFDHLWANDIGPSGNRLQADDAGILSFVAAHLRHQPGLLGYEILNEPWPGSVFRSCLNPATGCPAFDKGPLSAYYRRMATALRAADPVHMIWYEPLVTFNFGTPTSVTPPGGHLIGFAFHDYKLCTRLIPTAPCGRQDALVISHALAQSAATGNALLETEFGATTNTAQIAGQLSLYDQNMISWMFWSYPLDIDPPAPGGSLLPPTPGNLNQPVVNVLTRPYPQLVSGTPTAWNFDPGTDIFTLQYSTARADGAGTFAPGAVTQIAVPARVYPHGYRVTVGGGVVIPSPDLPGILLVGACRGASTVTVTVSPGTQGPGAGSCG